ncbi:SDR family oxidoreductase [Flavobacterium paronense]|uniref:SDR family NAD(P)-dependent oxidoreductase n=1 Tax=Flavobacterium paronense TaxID=1392775 RepID=A0ABV5GB62_9FLAO|nr:SDR family oxidoreductase [Flavobacterium paronense]MDN3675786.1 SDR family oxidoreductase [Flavobacterium paronense]MDN3675798.1 SDR family oxidoreductase [Flavobacterium paronense]MDN3676837.1 SDR family oxidoreductase [Flavobacterium paronense]
MNILITGGASGLGEAITKTLAKNENNVVYFTFNKSVAAAKKLEKQFKNVKGIQCNFEEESTLKSLSEIINELDLDVVIHNAYNGDYLKSHFHKIDSNDFLTDFKANVIPVVEISQAAITHFRKKKSGKIITILTSALQGMPPIGSAVYTSNKAYLEKLTQVWANENTKFNITSNSISPSFMETAMTSATDDRVKEQMIESNPLKRLLTTNEVAEAVQFLVNDVTQINGKDFVINAGSILK